MPSGKGQDQNLHEAVKKAAKDGKWGQGEHTVDAKIQVVLTENPGNIKEYIVVLSK